MGCDSGQNQDHDGQMNVPCKASDSHNGDNNCRSIARCVIDELYCRVSNEQSKENVDYGLAPVGVLGGMLGSGACCAISLSLFGGGVIGTSACIYSLCSGAVSGGIVATTSTRPTRDIGSTFATATVAGAVGVTGTSVYTASRLAKQRLDH